MLYYFLCVLPENHLSTFLQTSQRVAQLRLTMRDETGGAIVGMVSRWNVREALGVAHGVADTQQRGDRCPGDTGRNGRDNPCGYLSEGRREEHRRCENEKTNTTHLVLK